MNIPRDDQQEASFRQSRATCPKCGRGLKFAELNSGIQIKCGECGDISETEVIESSITR